MTMWKFIAGLGAIAGGIVSAIVIIAVCIWLVTGIITWLFDHSFAEVFGGEQEDEYEAPMRDRIPVPPPIPRPVPPNPAKQVKAPPLSADQYQIFPGIVAKSFGMEVRPVDVWVVDSSKAKIAFKTVEDAVKSVPLGKSFRVLDNEGKVLQQGTKSALGENLVSYWYPF